MSDEKGLQPPSEAPPVYPIPVPAPVPAYSVKDETPRTTAPPPPVPVPISSANGRQTTAPPPPPPVPISSANGRQYQELFFVSCAGGHHDPTTKFGTCGIITAICCFPIGLLCLCADKETRCARCGVLLH